MADPQMRATATALEAFDAFGATEWPALLAKKRLTNQMVYRFFQREARLAEAVGIAFGHDTDDINNMDTCRGCVRPGPWLRERIAQAAE